MFGRHPDGLPQPGVSLGYPQPHVQVRLVDGETNTEGVLEVKTAAAMNGYLNLPEKTSEKTTPDGWINTGDTMRVDENGFYFFVGRDDDMFNCSGENIYPGEIERILEADPRISECSVVPLADEIRGQVPVAFVVAAADSEIAEQTVKDIVLANAPAYMHPRHVLFMREMPLAGTSKIDRKMLEGIAAGKISRS
jgi:acyl-CoA synthetase (AMP-forming)/AMP-acid ligase II